MNFRLFIFIFLNLSFGSLWAEEIHLFQKPGIPSINYEQRIRSLEQKDILIFSNEHRFEFLSLFDINAGSSNYILKVRDLQNNGKTIVLRLQKSTSKNTNSLNRYLKGLRTLQEQGVLTMHLEDSADFPLEYLALNFIPIRYTLKEYLFLKKRHQIDTQEQIKVDNALVRWAESSWAFSYISDFDVDQIGFDGENWILFDFNDGHEKFDPSNLKTANSHALSRVPTLDFSLRMKIAQVIHDKRVECSDQLSRK